MFIFSSLMQALSKADVYSPEQSRAGLTVPLLSVPRWQGLSVRTAAPGVECEQQYLKWPSCMLSVLFLGCVHLHLGWPLGCGHLWILKWLKEAEASGCQRAGGTLRTREGDSSS